MTISQIFVTGFLVLTGWFAVLMGVNYVSSAAPAHLVMFPSDQLLDDLGPDMRIVSSTAWSVTLILPKKTAARHLYARGAFIVFPAGLSGCSGRSVRAFGKNTISFDA